MVASVPRTLAKFCIILVLVDVFHATLFSSVFLMEATACAKGTGLANCERFYMCFHTKWLSQQNFRFAGPHVLLFSRKGAQFSHSQMERIVPNRSDFAIRFSFLFYSLLCLKFLIIV